MSGTIVEIEIPADEFALNRTLSSIEGIEFEIERVVAHGPDRVMPFLWASNSNQRQLETVLADDPSIDQFKMLADLDGERLYRMEWVDQIETLVQILIEEEGTVLAATGNDMSWNLRVLFAERDSVSRTYEYCEGKGLTLDILNIYRLEEGRKGRFGLTEDQENALTAAFESGYYDIPREMDAGELADELGITHQAVSERLRRAHGNLVKNAIIIGRGADDPSKK